MSLRAYAKINLTLDVVGKRPNGYHDVQMIMQQIDLYDHIYLSKNKNRGINLTTTHSLLPTNEENIAYKAAKSMIDRYDLSSDIDIKIEKNIPISAGLAGGSTDAAQVILGMNDIYHLNLSLDEMMTIGLSLGADVPFCLLGHCALAEGLGEKLTPIHHQMDCYVLLCKPAEGVSTQKVYQSLDYKMIDNHPNSMAMIEALKNQSLNDLVSHLGNVLEPVTMKFVDSIQMIKDKMISLGAIESMMSGSGPTVFGIFESLEKAEKAKVVLQKQYKETYVVRFY